MKKLLLMATLLTAFIMSGCGSEKKELYVYNWGEYIDTEVVSLFEEEFDVKVIYEEYDSNEIMYAKIKEDPGSYDVLFPSDYMIEQLIDEGLIQELSWENIPNIENVYNRFRKTDHDIEGRYSAPYMWGTVGILYNTEFVTEPVESWDILWDTKYAGQIFMYDSMRDSLAVSLKRLGYSLNTRSEEELEEAKQALIEQKPLVQGYHTDLIKEKMIGGQGALAVVYNGDAMYAQSLKDTLEYAIPKEGSNIWWDGMVVTSESKNKELAEQFINFMLRPEIAKMNTEYIGYSTANEACIPLLDEEMVNNHIFNPSDEELENCQFFKALGDFNESFSKAWTEVLVTKN